MSYREIYSQRLIRKRYVDALRTSLNTALEAAASELELDAVPPVVHFLELDDVSTVAGIVELEGEPICNVALAPFFRASSLGNTGTGKIFDQDVEYRITATILAPGVWSDHVTQDQWEEDAQRRVEALDRADVYQAALIQIGRLNLPCGPGAIRVELLEGNRQLTPNLSIDGERIETSVTWSVITQVKIEETQV